MQFAFCPKSSCVSFVKHLKTGIHYTTHTEHLQFSMMQELPQGFNGATGNKAENGCHNVTRSQTTLKVNLTPTLKVISSFL